MAAWWERERESRKSGGKINQNEGAMVLRWEVDLQELSQKTEN